MTLAMDHYIPQISLVPSVSTVHTCTQVVRCDHRYSNAERDWTNAHCNEVTLFIVYYNGCYDNNMWWYMVLYMMTVTVASSSACSSVLYRAKNKYN